MNSRLTLDYGLRFVHQQPQYDSLSQSSNFFPDQWSPSAAPLLYLPACPGGVNPCATTARQALNPVTGQTARAQQLAGDRPGRVRQREPDQRHRPGRRRHRQDQLHLARHCAGAAVRRRLRRERQSEAGAPRRRRAVLRPAGRQLGLPARSATRRSRRPRRSAMPPCRISAAAGCATSGAPTLQIFQYDAEAPVVVPVELRRQMSLPWSSTLDVSYVGNHGYNLLSGTADINAPDLGARSRRRIRTRRWPPAPRPAPTRCRSTFCAPTRARRDQHAVAPVPTTSTRSRRRSTAASATGCRSGSTTR